MLLRLFMKCNYQSAYLTFSLCVRFLTLSIYLTGSDPVILFGSHSSLTKNASLQVEKQGDGGKTALGQDSEDPPLPPAISLTSGKSPSLFFCQPSTFHLFGLLNGLLLRIWLLFTIHVYKACRTIGHFSQRILVLVNRRSKEDHNDNKSMKSRIRPQAHHAYFQYRSHLSPTKRHDLQQII